MTSELSKSRATEQRVADALRRQAAALAPAVPPTLHARIMLAVASAARFSSPVPRPSHPLSLWLPAAAAILVIALGAWWLATPPARPPAPLPSTLAPLSLNLGAPLAALSEAVRNWSASPFTPEAAALQRDLSDAGRFLLACVGSAP
jgi:hypothetical protein